MQITYYTYNYSAIKSPVPYTHRTFVNYNHYPSSSIIHHAIYLYNGTFITVTTSSVQFIYTLYEDTSSTALSLPIA